MTVADWKAAYDTQVRPLMPWLPEADFELTPNGENRGYYRGLSPLGRSMFYVPDHAVELDLLKHEAGHAAHDAAAHQRDAIEGHGTAGVDIWREVAAIVSPGVTWPTSGPDLRDEWTAEAFRKAIDGDLAIVRYPDPPGVASPYPVAALLTYFQTITLPRTVPAVDCAFAEWIPSPNYRVGGNAMTGILDHWTVTTSFQAALNTLTLPNGDDSVSSHYLIGRDGRIAQLVREVNCAFHVLPQYGQARLIGIEHQHMPGEDWPTAQLEASARLHRDIAARNAIPLTRTFVLGHRDTGYNTACPGDLPIDRLLEDHLNMEITETRLREIIKEEATTPIRDAVKAGFGTVLNQKLRRTARWLKFSGPPGARDPGGVGGNETTGYPDDNTPLA